MSDELDDLMKLDLMVTREDMAQEIKRRFQANAEVFYSKILSVLYNEDLE